MTRSMHTRKHGGMCGKKHGGSKKHGGPKKHGGSKKHGAKKGGSKGCGCSGGSRRGGSMSAVIEKAAVPAALFVSNLLFKGKKGKKSGRKSRRYSRRR